MMDADDSLDGTETTARADFGDVNFDSNEFVRKMIQSTTTSSSSLNDNQRTAKTTHDLMKKSTRVELFLRDINLQIGRVKKSLHLHVTDNQDFLMQRLSNVSLLFSDIKQVRAGVSMLQTSTSRIRREILDPLDELRVQSKYLTRVQQASMILRQATRILQLSTSLRKEVEQFHNVTVHENGKIEERQIIDTTKAKTTNGDKANTANSEVITDLPKVANLVQEITKMLNNETSLKQVVDNSVLVLVEESLAFVKRRATKELTNAIAHFDQSQVSKSLQVFFNLECLPGAVNNVLQEVIECIKNSVVTSLDARSIAREADKGVIMSTTSTAASTLSHVVGMSDNKNNPMPANGRTKIWRRVLWTQFDDDVCEEIHKRSLQVWNLQRILCKKRDPITHMNFLELLKRDYKRKKMINEDDNDGGNDGGDKNNIANENDKGVMGIVYGKYWMSMTRELALTFLSTGRSFTFIKNVLITEYPSFRERMESKFFLNYSYCYRFIFN